MNGITETIANINSRVNDIVWGVPALVLLIGMGVLMAVLTRFFPVPPLRAHMEVVCTCTALVILTTGVVDMENGASVSGATRPGLATEAFTKKSFGTFGGVFLAVAVILFAFTAILDWSYYGTRAREYLFGTKSTLLYKILKSRIEDRNN